jgi:hypothetical protein
MRTIQRTLVAVLCGSFATTLPAQLPLPLGPQTIANTTHPADQDQAVVAADAAGNFVVVWRADDQDGDGSAIVARRFAARSGSPLGGEILINVGTTGNQENPAVAMTDDGRFVVAWEGPDPQGNAGIFGSLRAANGTPIVAEFPVTTTPAGDARKPAVAMRPDGDFLVAWDAELGTPNPSREIFGRIFDLSSGPGNVFQINRLVVGDQEQPSVAADRESGEWFAVWQGVDLASSVPAIFFLKLLVDGPPPPQVIEALLSLSSPPGVRRHASIAANTPGDAVAVWEGPDASGTGVFSRAISNDVPIGSEVAVNLTVEGNQREPAVALDDDDQFVATWIHETGLEAPVGSPIVVQGRKKGRTSALAVPPDPDGEFQISTAGDDPADPWVVSERRGNFVVAWQAAGVDDPGDPLGRAAVFRAFAAPIFADDFETGDASRWSAVQP